MVTRVHTGDVALLSVLDLDEPTAAALVAARPAAVLNLRASASGRRPARGARLLAQAGIPLVDHVDAALASVRDGATVTLSAPRPTEPDYTALNVTSDDGPVWVRVQAGALDVLGQWCDERAIEAATNRAEDALLPQVGALGAHVAAALDALGPLVVRGEGLPLTLTLAGREAVVVAPGAHTARDWRALTPYVRERRPVIIAVGEAATLVREAGHRVDFVVGDIDALPDAVVQAAGEIILHRQASRGGVDQALVARAQGLGASHVVSDLEVEAVDLALLAAHHGGARVVVTVGVPGALEDYLDVHASPPATTVLVRMVAADTLVSARTAAAWHRASIPAVLVALMVGVAAVALGVALWLTPESHDWVVQIWPWSTP